MAVCQKLRSCLWRLSKEALSTWLLQIEFTIIPIKGFHGRFSILFGRARGSSAAVLDQFGLLVGHCFAGDDYTSVGYFVAADKLFADIKHITNASDVQVLWSCWSQKLELNRWSAFRPVLLWHSSKAEDVVHSQWRPKRNQCHWFSATHPRRPYWNGVETGRVRAMVSHRTEPKEEINEHVIAWGR